MSKIENKVALVTGANRGIGKAFVKSLLEKGASKIYAAARNIETLQDLIAEGKGRVIAHQLDVNDADQVKKLAAETSDVELLINNAGIAEFQGFIAADNIDAARREMETNYFAPMNISRHFAPILKTNGGGAIINIASIASHVNFPVLGSYSASKAATHSLTQGIRAELASQGTFVMGVYPGPIDTDMAAGFPMDKTPPSTVTNIVLEGLENGDEDIYPDPAALEMHTALISDAKALEKQVAEMLPE